MISGQSDFAIAGAMSAVHAPEKIGGRRALVTMCIGVGHWLALAIERV